MGEFFCCSNTREVIDTKRIFLSNLSTFVCQNRFVLSLGFCRGSRVEGSMLRVEGTMSRVEGAMSRVFKK